MKRIMIAGTGSGCGKTTTVCAVIQALVNRGIDVSSFKCGPDYIDPMFHSHIMGVSSRNLDSWFCDENTIIRLLNKNSGEIFVIESVMGFYDGISGRYTSYDMSLCTLTPVIMIIDCKGMSSSIGAVMKGFLTFREPNNICGFIFNRLPEKLVPEIKELCQKLNTQYLGRIPYDKNCSFESRHLGLVTANEISDIKQKLSRLSEYAEKHICLDKIIKLSEAPELYAEDTVVLNKGLPVRLAVASDKAFCFIYEDNLELLRELGCEIVKFSPIEDKRLPENISGLLLCGGYPELYLKELSSNKTMLSDIRNAVISKMPVIAECGGFMYLHRQIKDEYGNLYSMAGVIDAVAYKTSHLQRFGYTRLIAQADNVLCKKNEEIKTHEFHYWDSTDPGNSFRAIKASDKTEYSAVHADISSYMGFPHLYFYSDVKVAENFASACRRFKEENEKN